jgi:hypothetical protein
MAERVLIVGGGINHDFCTVHWPLDQVLSTTFAEEHPLAAPLSVLPIHRRCEPRDIARGTGPGASAGGLP